MLLTMNRLERCLVAVWSIVLLQVCITHGRQFDRCELASLLLVEYPNLSFKELNTWMCIAQNTQFNSSVISYGDDDDHRLHGIFQLSDRVACANGRSDVPKRICRVFCKKLNDDKIADDFFCAKKVYNAELRVTGNGFAAWPNDRRKCAVDIDLISDCNLKFVNRNHLELNGRRVVRKSLKSVRAVKERRYTRCSLFRELEQGPYMSFAKAALWTCFAFNEPGWRNSSIKVTDQLDRQDVRLRDLSPCTGDEFVAKCGATCAEINQLNDTDYLLCVHKIFHGGQSKNTWLSYKSHCNRHVEDYSKDCYNLQDDDDYENDDKDDVVKTDDADELDYSVIEAGDNDVIETDDDDDDLAIRAGDDEPIGKIYNRCELARELLYVHKLPAHEIHIWVCIAQHESEFDTTAIGMLNADNSHDHGIFQISDKYWCSPGTGCNIECVNLRDANLTDDIACLKKIFAEGGFGQWATYESYCENKDISSIDDCFSDAEFQKIKNSIAMADAAEKDRQMLENDLEIVEGRQFSACELARILVAMYDVLLEELDEWLCIIEHESQFNTASVSDLHQDGSREHGLFKISDSYWCSPPNKGTGCGIPCSKLRDKDITDDIECVKKIIDADGFDAWQSYRRFCNNSNITQYSKQCFEASEPELNDRIVIAPTKPSTGKVYSESELANELRVRFKVPEKQIPIWVCIAKHESNLITDAVGPAGADGNRTHGIFKISGQYWCSENGVGRICAAQCSSFEDSDISDDFACAQRIFEDAKGWRQDHDGFGAWGTYTSHCKANADVADTSRDLERDTGKIYSETELAAELRDKFNVAEEQIPIWVCIAKHESNLNTSWVSEPFANGNRSHGLFRISGEIFCSEDGAGRFCSAACSSFEDSDISDDFACALKIFADTEGWRSDHDGFAAWASYSNYCKANSGKVK